MTPINYFTEADAYNTDFFETVEAAAIGVASPFLVQQTYGTIPGATVNGATVTYNGLPFEVYTSYINPNYNTPGINTYFIPTPAAFTPVWPNANFPNGLFPNALFYPSPSVPGAGLFKGTLDCVGFGFRVLTVAGSSMPNGNAYCQLLAQIDTAAMHFAAPGYVASALEVSIAWPVLLKGAWSYIAGYLDTAAIQTYENGVSANLQQPDKTYTGNSQGGFSTAQAGDIVSFGYIGGGSNGHFMVLAGAPALADSSIVTNLESFVTQVYSIGVYDSTDFGGSLHYSDSRLNNAAISCGIGYGELYILTNAQDEPVGFVFGPNELAHYVSIPNQNGSQVVAAITVARFQ